MTDLVEKPVTTIVLDAISHPDAVTTAETIPLVVTEVRMMVDEEEADRDLQATEETTRMVIDDEVLARTDGPGVIWTFPEDTAPTSPTCKSFCKGR